MESLNPRAAMKWFGASGLGSAQSWAVPPTHVAQARLHQHKTPLYHPYIITDPGLDPMHQIAGRTHQSYDLRACYLF
jgi:hypothetical protein